MHSHTILHLKKTTKQTVGKKNGFIIITIVNRLFQKGPVTTSVPPADAEGSNDVSLFICFL